MHPQQSCFVDSVTFHAQRNTIGETQSAQYSVALFVASDATDTWQSCYETVTQGCVTLWSESAVSVFRRENKETSQCLPLFLPVLLLQPPPFSSFVVLSSSLHRHTSFSSSCAVRLPCLLSPYLFPPILSPLLSLTLPFHHPLHPVTKADSLL